MIEILRNLPLFAEYPDDILEQMSAAVHERTYPEGAVVLREGDEQQGVFLLLDGEFEVCKRVHAQDIVLSRHQPGAVAGEVALLTDTAQPLTIRTTRPSRFLLFDAAMFATFKNTPFALLITSMAERMRSMESVVYQQDKLSALGKMAAGLTHELNNPASASRRAAQLLPEMLNRMQALALQIGALGYSEAQTRAIAEIQQSLCTDRARVIAEDPLETSDRVDDVEAWLKRHDISTAVELAPGLASAGIDSATLDRLVHLVSDRALPPVLQWLIDSITVSDLVGTMERGTARISELVRAVKAYSHLDRAHQYKIDLHDGIESTLTIFSHRLKNVRVERVYDRSLPIITAYAGELNQVWTNLIDNALDAMQDSGVLSIETAGRGDWVTVTITDSGSGVPQDLQGRIFEPFFTTKPLGQGTGLGLDIVYRIVTERHHGKVELTSEPGKTSFRVYLPRDQREG